MKAYGFPMTPDHDNCFGMVISEDGKFLGCRASSNYSWLKIDLQSKCKGYEFEWLDTPPSDYRIISALLNTISELEDQIKEMKGQR
jgi:hypothetical protein